MEIAVLADANGWEISTTVGLVTYYRQRPGQAIGPLSPNRVIVGKNSDAIVDSRVRILTTNPEAIKSIQSLCQAKFSGRCYTEVYYGSDGGIHSLGVFAPGANKGDAIDLVLRHQPMTMKELHGR